MELVGRKPSPRSVTEGWKGGQSPREPDTAKQSSRFSLLHLTFQSYQVSQQIGQLVSRQLIAIGRHRRFERRQLSQIGSLECDQPFLGIENLKREVIQVEKSARRDRAVFVNRAKRPVCN